MGKKAEALDVLLDVMRAKRHRTFRHKIHEPIMRQLVELCVDLRQVDKAKEGLYLYKNMTVNVEIKTIDDLVRYFLKLGYDRVAEKEALVAEMKRASAAEAPAEASESIDDLEALHTPERYSRPCSLRFRPFTVNRLTEVEEKATRGG